MAANGTIIAEKDATILKLAKENAIMKEVLHTERRNYTACIKEIARLQNEYAELNHSYHCAEAAVFSTFNEAQRILGVIEKAKIKLLTWRNIVPEKLECDADIVETLAILEEAKPQPQPFAENAGEKKEGRA